MGKLRNHGGDTLVGMAQWIGRKIRHHDPLSDVDNFNPVRHGQRGKLRVGIAIDDPMKVVYLLGNGERYAITVRKIDPEEEVEVEAVGA
jgi:hypothetical protein